METQVYSARLGRISPAQFQAALDRFGLGAFVRAAPIPLGNFGQNVFVTATSGEYVLRGAPHYAWQFPKERLIAHLLHERTGAPVPWPYLLDPSDDIFGWSYALMPRLPGLQLGDPAVYTARSAADRRRIAAALGAMLARLHRLTWPHPGDYDLDADTIVPFAGDYRDRVVARIRHNLAVAREHGAQTTASDASWVESVLAAGYDILGVPSEPCIVMEDYTTHNVVVERAERGWRVSGVFDLMTPYFGDGEADLSRQVAMYWDDEPACARTFLRSYLGRRPPRRGFGARFPIYMLDDRLIIWTWAHRHGVVWWDTSWSLRTWAERYMSAGARLVPTAP
jgi:aminoglycoside phosphotransferase (APT) family kinase protein